MADFDLGTARGKIELDASGAESGAKKATGAIGDIENSASKSGANVKAVGLGLVSFGAAAVGAFALAINASANFEKSLSGFAALGKDYKDNLDQIREKALQLGADTAFSAQEAADAMVELGKQGLSVTDIMDGAADATVALAAAGEIELTEAAAISAAALNQFKLSAKELPGIADLLAGAANASATGVSEIGAALSFVGPVAEAAGISITDTAGAIALLANNGIDGQKAGTALRAIISRLTPASKEASGAMRELGIITKDGSNQFFDAQGNVKSLGQVFDILNKTTSKLTAEQKIQALQTIFGTEALAAANVMAGTTAESFGALQAQIGEIKAADVAKEKMNNLSGAIEELKGSLETAMIRAGAPFQEGLKGIAQTLTSVVNAFSNLSPEIQKYIGFAVAAVGVASLLAGGFILAGQAVTALKSAMLVLNAAFLTNPIVLFIAAIAAIGAAVFLAYQKFPAFREAVDKLWQSAQPIIDNLRQKFGEFATFISTVVVPGIQSAFQQLSDWFNASALPRIGEVFTTVILPALSGFLVWFQATFGPGLQSAAELATTGVQSAFTALSEGISVGGFVETLTNLGNTIISVFTTVATFFTTVILPAVQAFVTGAIEQLGLFIAWIQTTFSPLITAIGELFSAVWTRVQEVVAVAIPIIMGIIGAFVAVIMVLWQTFGDDIIRIIQVAWDFIAQIVAAAVQIITGIVQVATAIISGDWGKAWDGIKNILQGAWNAITAIVTTAVELLFNLLRAAVGAIGQILNLGWQGIKAAAEWAWNALKDAIVNKFNEVTAPIRGVIDTVKGILDIDLSAIGRNLIQGFINGIKSGLGGVQSAVKSIADAVPGPIKSLLGIHSPSRVMEGIADDTMAGFFKGLDNGIGSVGKLMATVAPTVTNSILTNTGSLPLPAASTGGNVSVVFNYSGNDPENFVNTVNNSDLVSRITSAARARRS